MYEIPPKTNNILASKSIKSNKEFISKIINQPIAKYNKREMNSYLPVKKSFFKVPSSDKVSTIINILTPEWL